MDNPRTAKITITMPGATPVIYTWAHPLNPAQLADILRGVNDALEAPMPAAPTRGA
jgi:hypothetical protein